MSRENFQIQPMSELSPEERVAELAVILAKGVRRLHSHLCPLPSIDGETSANLAISDTGIGLDFPNEFRPDRLALVNGTRTPEAEPGDHR